MSKKKKGDEPYGEKTKSYGDLDGVTVPMDPNRATTEAQKFANFSPKLPAPKELKDELTGQNKEAFPIEFSPDNFVLSKNTLPQVLFWGNVIKAHDNIQKLSKENKVYAEATWRDNYVIALVMSVCPDNVIWISEHSIKVNKEHYTKYDNKDEWAVLPTTVLRLDGSMIGNDNIFFVVEYKKEEGSAVTTDLTRNQAFTYAALALLNRSSRYGDQQKHRIITMLVEQTNVTVFLLQTDGEGYIEYCRLLDTVDLLIDGLLPYCAFLSRLPEFIEEESAKYTVPSNTNQVNQQVQPKRKRESDSKPARPAKRAKTAKPTAKKGKKAQSSSPEQTRESSEEPKEEYRHEKKSKITAKKGKKVRSSSSSSEQSSDSMNSGESSEEAEEDHRREKKSKKKKKKQSFDHEQSQKPKKDHDDSDEGDHNPTPQRHQHTMQLRKTSSSNTKTGSYTPKGEKKHEQQDFLENYLPTQFFFAEKSPKFVSQTVTRTSSMNMNEYVNLNWQKVENTTYTIAKHDQDTFRCTQSLGSELNVLLPMQDHFFVPQVMAYWWNDSLCRYVTKEYSDKPSNLTLSAMIKQLLNALSILHSEYIVLNTTSKDTIQWDGNSIKFVNWRGVSKRGLEDGAITYSQQEDRNSPTFDLFCAGQVIKHWSEQMNDFSFSYLSDALTRHGMYRRIPIAKALEAIDNPSVVEEWNKFTDVSNLTLLRALKLCDEFEINQLLTDQTKSLITTAASESNFKWQTIDKMYAHIQYGSINGKEIVGKLIRRITVDWRFGREFFITKLLSGKLHMPTLLEYEILTKGKYHSILMVFPKYNAAPKKNNIKLLSLQLLSAIATMHKYGLIHSDIAPQNLMWDDMDQLVLIDFGSTYYANHLQKGTCDEVPYGHRNFQPKNEPRRYPATDIYSAGKVIEHYASEWNQMTPKLKKVIDLMTCYHWCERLTLSEAKVELEKCF